MSTAAIDQDQTTDPLAHFVAVHANTLRSTGAVAADLFVQYEPQSAPVLYCRAGSQPDAQQFVQLEEAGVEDLYVREADFSNFSNGIYESLTAILANASIPAAEKFAALQLAVAVAVDQSLRLLDCNKFRNLAEQVGKDVVELLAGGALPPRELFRIVRHDFNTFSHVTNVAGYCVMLAQRMCITDPNQLRKIASAAVLHDVGKRFIPAKILAKCGRLTPEEQEIVQSHPRRGYEELCETSGLDFGQLMMVYQHHEHVDGTGYPVCVQQKEIHPWARMLAVVDVFDTMTARRPDRLRPTPEHVLHYQQQLAGTHFDREVVECWVSAMNKT
jgi:HD-GYP domain-containing protein (c-di-GMP phosphodiesterase class II)